MKLLVEVTNKDDMLIDNLDGVILSLLDYAVESTCFYTIDEIIEISNSYTFDVFVKINKNLMNEDVDKIKDILIRLDKSKIKGIFFYDLALLKLKKDLNLSIPLVWSQTHMVNNYKTCDFYYNKGVNYALLGKEITLDEIKEIIDRSKITSMVEVIGKPSVAFSKRKLVTNYYKDLGIEKSGTLLVKEKVTDTNYKVVEDNNGTSFFLDVVVNGTSVIKDLYDSGCKYIVIREYGIEDIFKELVSDTLEYIKSGCISKEYVEKYKKLGDNTNFFFKKTIYRVKKNG